MVLSEQRLKMRSRPSQTRIMYQEWRNLLFLHFKYNRKEIQKTLPKGLYVDTFNDEAYLTITPFFIKNLKAFILPSFPFLSDFIEVNLRTYVYDENETPGIWFYSLDINSLIATIAAQQLFFLPYKNATLNSETTKLSHRISGYRNDKEKAYMDFTFSHNDSNTYEADVNSLDFFLLERYALFTENNNRLYIQKIHHSPYLLSSVNLINHKTNLLEVNNFQTSQAVLEKIHYCSGLNVDFFPLENLLK